MTTVGDFLDALDAGLIAAEWKLTPPTDRMYEQATAIAWKVAAASCASEVPAVPTTGQLKFGQYVAKFQAVSLVACRVARCGKDAEDLLDTRPERVPLSELPVWELSESEIERHVTTILDLMGLPGLSQITDGSWDRAFAGLLFDTAMSVHYLGSKCST